MPALPFILPPVYPPAAPSKLASAIVCAPPAVLPRLPNGAICLLGMPDDVGVSMNGGRPGAKGGPAAFRSALARYGVREPMGLDHPLPPIGDAGDIVPGDTLDETHARVSAAATAIIQAGMFPVGIGGGHDLTFAFVRAACRSLGVDSGAYIDAHLDVRAEPGSGMPFRALVDHCGVRTLVCVGAEPFVNSREHAAWFTSHGGRQIPTDEAVARPATLFPEDRAFLSLDLDAINVSQAPGVSAINPGGIDASDAAAICLHAGGNPRVRCFDIMELNPLFDLDFRTARVAVYCFLHFLVGYSSRVPGAAA